MVRRQEIFRAAVERALPVSIFRRILLSGVLLALVPIAGITAYHFLYQRSVAALSELENLKSRSVSLAAEVDSYIAGHLNVVQLLATNEWVRGFVLSGPRDADRTRVIQSWLNEEKAVSPSYSVLYLLDPTGTCLASTDISFIGKNYAVRPYFRNAMKGESTVSDWTVGLTSGQAGIYFSSPIRKEQGAANIEGVFVLKLSVEKILKVVTRDKDSALAYFLLNRAGVLLAHNRPELAYRSLVPIETKEQVEIDASKQFASIEIRSLGLPPIKAAHDDVLQHGGTAVCFYRFEGLDKIATLSGLSTQHWTAGIGRPIDSIYINSRVILVSAVVVALISLIVAMAGSFYLARRITRPISDLLGAVVRFGEGDLAARASVGGADEVGRLSSAFNSMAGHIREQAETLERRVQERTQELEAAVAEVHALSISDPLTGCYNRRAMTEMLEGERARSRRYGSALSVVLCDIDHFKSVNDRHGHLAGDEVLRRFGADVRAVVRERVDWVCRYGGEEFLIVLPETDLAGALIVAERIRTRVATRPIPWADTSISITCSLGVAEDVPRPDGESQAGVDGLIGKADELLYLAKKNGRNRIESMPL